MLQYLIKITDNTLAAAIVMSFVFFIATRMGAGFSAVLNTDASTTSKKPLWIGGIVGTITALIYAILKRNTGFAVREYYDLSVIIPLILFIILFLSLVWQRFGADQSACPMFKISAAALLGAVLAATLPNIFLSPFEFSVGMDSIYNADFLAKVVGYLLALVLMFLIGLSVYQLADKTPHPLLRILVFSILFVFLLQSLLEVMQILVGRNLTPRAPWFMGILMTALAYKNVFAYSYMALLSCWAAYIFVKVRLTSLSGANPAQIRLMKADHRRQSRYSGLIVTGLALSLLTITVARDVANREVEISPAIEVAEIDGMVGIPLTQIDDGNLHRHQYTTASGTAVRFIVIKKNATAYGVGLDACDICGASGYYQRGDQVVCKLCDVVMNKSTIGFPGGCNPVPLNFSIVEGQLKIKAQELEAEKQRFE